MTSPEKLLMLLCCPLGQAVKPFTPTEFQELSALVPSAGGDAAPELNEASLREQGFPPELSRRIAALVNREDQLRVYLQAQPDITPVTRISPGFPRRLRRLGKHCPPVLFCKGQLSLLQTPCVSVVGSRQLLERGRRFARQIGRLAATEGYTLVSGNARGADLAAQEACLEAGGNVIAFVADSLLDLPKGDRVLYCGLEGYEVSFTPYRALARNHPIHALGEKVFVAQCPQARGGTWDGAAHNLRHGLSPVYVLDDGAPGTAALLGLGAIPVPEDLRSIRYLTQQQLSIFD